MAPGHQSPGAEERQDIHGRDVGEVEEHRVAIGVQRSIGVEGSDRLVNGSAIW